MENTKMYDPAGVVDLSELDELAINSAAGLTPFVATLMVTVLSFNAVTGAYTVTQGN